jgi:DNA primase
MRYNEALLDEILRRTDLVQLVGKRVKLERKGRVFWGLCPFHKEKTPSFKVENERRTFHCFGCGAGGDAFKWLRETEGLNFPEAVKQLADVAGVQLPAFSPEEEEREARRKSLYDVVELAAQFFEEQLRAGAGAGARDYLKSRGLNGEICARFRIGYAPDANAALIAHLQAHNVSLDDMVEAGLARAAEGGRAARDFFFNRVMFPIEDFRGRIVAFGGRALSADAKPKYINTGETTLFSKGRLLYNFRSARAAAMKDQPLILAEGYMDVIALVRAGFHGSVAPLGTALTEDQLQLLWRLAPEPVICLDGDEAGVRAAERASRLALGALKPGYSLRFVFLPEGEDPDSFLRAQGQGPMRLLIEKAQSLADVLWQSETAGRDFSTPERRAGLESELDGIVKKIRDPKIADYYKRDFGERVFHAFKQRRGSGSREGRSGSQWQGRFPPPGKPDYAKRDYRGDRPSRARPQEHQVSPAVRQSLHAINAKGAPKLAKERELMGLVLQNPDLIERDAEILARILLTDPQLDRLKDELLHLAASGARLEKSLVESHIDRQGMGALAERLRNQPSVLYMAKDRGEAGLEEAWRRAVAQLEDPDFSLHGELKLQRDAAFTRYLDSGTEADFDEVQRLNGLIRAQMGS